ncbi:MAG: alpha/beta hydrolase [Gammaproteobacteria bacterium]|nr:alpha/beta hydrolase [Gammaproteobacteria bacterium]
MINKSNITHTKYNYRINQIKSGSDYNWIFLPGGPGLGSEYLLEFCNKLNLPGNTLVVDFPKDGTNNEGTLEIKYWQDGLIDLLKTYKNSILVTHSFAGMFALNMPEIESHLAGLILMNTTTHNSFFQHVHAMHLKHHLPNLAPAAAAYHLHPSKETFKEFWNTYKYYCFTPEEMELGEQMIPLLAFNSEAYYFAIQNFFMQYVCKLHPTSIPTMTICSENDFICPPDIFSQEKYFQSDNITNKIIANAGHCPWLLHFNQVKKCFDAFIASIQSRK